MTTDKRTSQRGVPFKPASTVRDVLLMALAHNVVIDQANELLLDHLERSTHISVVAESLKRVLDEMLEAATFEDWEWVARALTAEACESLGIENPLDRTPGVQTRGSALGSLDSSEMREELGHLYAEKPLSPRKALRAWQLTRAISRRIDISKDEIRANARADAEAIQAAGEYDAGRADRGSAQAPAFAEPEINAGTPPVVAAYQMLRHLADQGGAVYVEDTRGTEIQGWVTGITPHEVSIEEIRTRENVYISLADIENMEEIEAVFVRPLSRHEASSLLDTGESSHSWMRKRAAIILASNFGKTVAEIAATQNAEAKFVRRVIAAFNEYGLKSLECSTLTTITLDTGQFNLLISGLGLARLALSGCGDEFVGFTTDYQRLADEIVAQLPGDGPAPRAARERLAIQEGRATPTRKPS